MVTTVLIDSSVMERFRDAVEKKYGKIRGHLGNEVKEMFEERIEKLNRGK